MGMFDDFTSGLIKGITSPDTILGGIQLFGMSGQRKEAQQQQAAAAQANFDQQVSLLNMKNQQEMEMLRLKASLSGGGGGGGGGASLALANAELALKRKELAQQKALAKYDAMRRGKETELSATNEASKLKQDAMQNLLNGATAPLLRG